jgi:hypothetical protein
MAMPGGVEMYRRYANMNSFRRDEGEMAREGWKTEGFRTREVPRGPLRRVLRRPPRIEVYAHYLRG